MNSQINFIAFTQIFVVIFLDSFSTVVGCGQFPQGEVTAMSFAVNGTVLPIEMGYSESNDVQVKVPTISTSEQTAVTRVQRQIMGAIEDILEQQGRSAFLPDALISQILQQLTVNISYMPIRCVTASTDGSAINNFNDMREGCFITSGLVSNLCKMNGCMPPNNNVEPVASKYMTFTGSLRTSNIIMANWSRQMWQSILSRVHRRLASLSNPFGTFFSRATVTLSN